MRPADMLVVDIDLVNLRFDGHRLVRRDPGAPAFVLAGLPPQHVLEPAPASLSAISGSVKAVTAGSTRLAFSVPGDVDGLDLTLAALLDWERLVPLTVPVGMRDPDTPGSVVFQGIPRSVIEFPARLLITYDEPVHWLGTPEPRQQGERLALWHARLHGGQNDEVLLRAFATAGAGGTPPAGSPLDTGNLRDLVTLTSRDELIVPGSGVPIDVPSAPLHSEQFIVTPLGTSAHLHGAWESAPDSDKSAYEKAGRPFPILTAYDHITGLGRDQYVRVVTHGSLNTGHEALHVTEFKRIFVARPNDGIVAYLQREDHVIPRQPEVSYGPAGFTYGGREMPFRSLRITDRATPVIEEHDDLSSFWVKLKSSGDDHEFTVIGTDCEGRKVSFTMPLVFVPAGVADPQLQVRYAEKPKSPDPAKDRLTRQMGGQQMAMAQPPADAPGSTCHAVGTLTFGFGTIGSKPEENHMAVGLPYVGAATVRVPAVEQFAPTAGDLAVTFNDTYLKQTMERHPAGAYLDLDAPIDLALGAEKAGGVASPKTALKLITAQAGVVPDVFKTDATGAVVDALAPSDMLKAFDGAKLLGLIDLGRILKALVKDDVTAVTHYTDDQIRAVLNAADGILPVPVMRIRDLADGQGKELRYVWKTRLANPGAPPEKGELPDVIDAKNATLTLDAHTVRSKGAPDQVTVDGRLNDFALEFADCARVEIAELRFRTGSAKKPEVTASGVELKFEGALEFINTLRSALPADVFGAGAYVDVQPSGVTAGYKFTVPTIGIGVFTLSNLALAAELKIPFDDGTGVTFRFSVSEREHPFIVTVSLFGGGGYFSLLVDAARGVRQLEGALEFGGAAALDLGVASGGVSVMAGIRFSLSDAEASLTGYLRCNGFLSVLGIVTVSVEFYLQLTYDKRKDIHQSVITGRGTLTVSVRIAFFSKSVKLSLERSFSGAPGDPSFTDCVLQPHWREYCEAYAP
ncbi:hypothetical protein [Streptomyces triticiradicis]|uniref:hypothetical protein n=1 Tax=Streptomyces triticiradicis TaxID=2651189 RepID=UPI001CEC51B4|nr:hypothetical protein [Streptomyces triticiradicis]